MKRLPIWLMRYYINQAQKSVVKEENTIVKRAKQHRLEIYKTTLLYLKN